MPKSDRVEEAIEFYRACSSAYAKQLNREKEDLQFQDGDHAWPDEVKQTRMAQTVNGVPLPARPMLSVATLDEPLQLVINQQRNAHLSPSIHPLTPDADPGTADVLEDLYRQIEVDSRAAFARNWAFDRALKAGRGAYVIRSEYDHTTGVSGDQKIVIDRLLYQSAAYLDPFALQPDWSDGERGLIVEDIPWLVYQRKYKGKKGETLSSYTDEGLTDIGAEVPEWIGGDTPETRTIRVGRYYYVEHETVTKHDQDGENYDVDVRHVHCCVVNAIEELESYEWGGHYIPIIPAIGRELQPWDGERRWLGMIRNARDGVRLTNYAASGAIEMAALEPKAPFQLDPEQIEGYESWWQQANTRNWPYLPSHSLVNGQKLERPARIQVDAGRMGPNMQLLSMGRDFVQAATQTFDPALGKQPTAHRSGRAIVALQDQTIEATGEFLGNFADLTLQYEATVILDAIPYYYDRPGRLARVRNAENKTRLVMLNQPHIQDDAGRPVAVASDHAQATHYGIAKTRDGRDIEGTHYGVTVSISKSYKSRLDAGNDAISQLLQSAPAFVPILGPLWMKYQDWPGHKEAAALLTKQRDHDMPWLSDAAGNGQPTAQQMQQLQQENQQLKQALGMTTQHIQTKQVEQQGKAAIVQIQESAETQRAREANEVKLAVAELSAKVERLQLFYEERARLGEQGHDVALGAAEHASAIAQANQAHQQAMQQAALEPPEPPASNGAAAATPTLDNSGPAGAQ